MPGIAELAGSAASAISGNKGMQNLGRSLTGNAVKAVLCVRAPKVVEKENDPEKKDSLKELEKAIKDVNTINDKLMEMAEESLKGRKASSTYSDIKDIVEGNDYIALEVQFNPSTLRLTTSAGMQTKYGEDAADLTVQSVPAPAATDLSFELLFDDVNSQDAFMLADNAITNTSTGNVYQAIKSAAKSKFSVQRQMEGLLALLSLDSARNVIFFWADMSFRGEVTAISNTYTMFNKKGYPVRGKVGMTIRQGDGSEDADEREQIRKYDESYWNKAFDRLFTADIKKTTVDKLSNNLLNLKL